MLQSWRISCCRDRLAPWFACLPSLFPLSDSCGLHVLFGFLFSSLTLSLSVCLTVCFSLQARVQVKRNINDDDFDTGGKEIVITLLIERINLADLEDEAVDEDL